MGMVFTGGSRFDVSLYHGIAFFLEYTFIISRSFSISKSSIPRISTYGDCICHYDAPALVCGQLREGDIEEIRLIMRYL